MGKELEVPVCLHNLHVHQTMTRINLTGRLRTAAVNRALALQGAKLQHGHIPLYVWGDDENTRQFPSLHAVQRHMADTGRFKMAWEDLQSHVTHACTERTHITAGPCHSLFCLTH